MKQYKFKFNLHKRYFDIGYSITNYLKYFILLFGAVSFQKNISLNLTIYIAFAYIIFCYIFGWAWVKFGWYEAEIEVGNHFNIFVNEVRKKLLMKKRAKAR